MKICDIRNGEQAKYAFKREKFEAITRRILSSTQRVVRKI
jgi:hypothetical protein